jgi:t-SNARE complex subunit (syntaxin)
MLDRLEELRSLCKRPELLSKGDGAPPPQVAPFLVNVRKNQGILEQIAELNVEAEELRNQFLRVANFDEEHKLKDQYKQVVNQRSRLLNSVRGDIDAMSKAVEAEKHEKPGLAETRMMESMYGTVARKFAEQLKAAEKTDTAFSQSCRQKVRDQVRMVDADASEEKVEQLLQHPQAMEQMYQQAIVGVNVNIKRMVEEIEERYNDIINLEESIRRMHEMFLHLAALVHSQGEILDNIEKNVDAAASYVEKGVQSLEKAKEHQSKARTRKCCLLVIVLVVLLVIIVPTVTVTTA